MQNNDNEKNKKNSLFSKRANQFKKFKKDENINSPEIELNINDTIFNDNSNVDELVSKNRNFIPENEYIETEEEVDLLSNNQEIDLLDDNQEIDLLSNNQEVVLLDNNEEVDLLDNNEEINLLSNNNKEYISLDDDDDDDIMNDMLSKADDILNDSEENNIDLEKDELLLTFLEGKEIEEIEEILESENLIEETEETEETEEIEEIEEEYSGFYNEEEVKEKRSFLNKINKTFFIKIGIGCIFIIIIFGLAFGVRKYLNKNSEKPDKVNETEVVEETMPAQESLTQDNDLVSKDDLLSDFETEDKETESLIEETIVEENSLFIQNYKGYIVDIKDNQLLISDMTFDKYNILLEDFKNHMGDSETTVIINNKPIEESTEETQAIENEVIDTEIETDETIDEETNNQETKENIEEPKDNTNYNLFHIEGCELIKEDKSSKNIKEALNEKFIPCETCCKDLNIKENVTVKDYDYAKNNDLKNIIFKKFNIEETTILPEWITIGSEVNITFIQDPNSLINEMVEINEFKRLENENSGGTSINPEETTSSEEQIESIEGSNVWGDNWSGVVAQINDRRNKDKENEKSKEDLLSLENLSLKESLETTIGIGKAAIVWFRIGFKGTKVEYFPEMDDIAVELQTSNGSLINDSNIEKYGKKWTADDGTINFVIKNTLPGDWKVLFTKNIGTYLGNIKIEAVPITGFLQIVDASAVYSDGKLRVIWNAAGVSDDNCKVQIYAKNGNKDILMYSGNTIDDGIHVVDMVDIDSKKIAGTTYDIYLKITDIDVSPTDPKTITATYITDTKTITNIEVPDFTKKSE